MQKKKIIQAIQQILEAIGENPEREGLKATPSRIAEMYEELLSGYKIKKPETILKPIYTTEKYSEIIIVKDIPFSSLCEHHLLPFFGKAHVGYLPQKKVLVGLSKIPRVVDAFAKRLQIQERLTDQIADTINRALNPLGVIVVVEAEHLCTTIRGVKKTGSKMITSALRGIFLKDQKVRAEALSLIKNG
ncbi:MAG: GTP cyclohydrolase I FolE [Elusimicrobia bacterium]|nr:GTP cyclohydrolase I FolE [Elusimicrobiota bacterium]